MGKIIKNNKITTNNSSNSQSALFNITINLLITKKTTIKTIITITALIIIGITPIKHQPLSQPQP